MKLSMFSEKSFNEITGFFCVDYILFPIQYPPIPAAGQLLCQDSSDNMVPHNN